jgi:hypothetical protein
MTGSSSLDVSREGTAAHICAETQTHLYTDAKYTHRDAAGHTDAHMFIPKDTHAETHRHTDVGRGPTH